ncbi:MAG: Mrp/NBP35 family ATP-binding protein [Bacillota bacterium]
MSESTLMNEESKTAIIAVASGKGGVGKSTVSVNLARALARLGYRTGIMDADIYGFTVPRLLGVHGGPEMSEEGIQPLEAHGMQVMSMGFFVDDTTPVIWRGPLLMKAVDQFVNDVLWDDDLDHLVIDLPPGTGDVPLTVAQRLPRASLLLVTLPELSSVRVASRAGNMARQTNTEIMGVVENMSSLTCPECGETLHPFGRNGGQLLANELGVPLLARIPMDSNLTSGREEAGLLVDDSESEAGAAINDLARRLTDDS